MKKAIRIVDAGYGLQHSDQVAALGGLGEVMGLEDNGGVSDGDLWLVVSKHTDEEVAEAVRLGAFLVTVYEADYNAEAWRACADQFSTGEKWSGVGEMGKAWFVDENDAKLCQRTAELMREDDNLDTLAYRLNTVEE
jgi:hypothetical protein